MAIYNEILTARFSRGLQKLFGMKGPQAVKQLAGEIAPVFPIFRGREFRILEDWRLYGVRLATNAVAAQDAVVRLTNPAGSNSIASVESISVVNASGALQECTLEMAAAQANLTNVNSIQGMDSRQPGFTLLAGSSLVASWANNVAQIGFPIMALQMQNGGSSIELVNFEEQEITLAPNSSIQIRTLSVNVAISVSFRWRERAIEDSERSA